jgi:hypothetical protein
MPATRAALLAGILAIAHLARAAELTASTDDETSAKQFTASIDAFNAVDPQSPDTLSARLTYANFLTRIEGGDCRAHLDEAQKQLNLVTAGRAFALVLPAASAHVASIEYQLHLQRASCGAGAAARDHELHAALEAAQRAVDLYRDAFDAVSMVTMQFNVGVAYHNLGDDAAAAAALHTTLDLDREYGYADDAADNYRVLLQWSNEDTGPEKIAAWMKDFPQRSATMSFGWFESDANLTTQSDVLLLAGGDVVHLQTLRTAQRHVRKHWRSWLVSYQLDDPHFEFDQPTNERLVVPFENSLAHVLAKFHDFRVSHEGDFDESKGDFGFYFRARADTKALVRDLGGESSQLAHRIGVAVRAKLPNAIEGRIAEQYNLETGTWIGATLEQGVWYDMSAALAFPLGTNFSVTHKIQFGYTRAIPCLPDSSQLSCIEIVLRATPDPTLLKVTLDALASQAHLAPGQVPRLWSITTIRLVTDPATLWTYSRETRSQLYWRDAESGPDQSLIDSEKTLESTSAPRADSSR